jgi:hypothetical protein
MRIEILGYFVKRNTPFGSEAFESYFILRLVRMIKLRAAAGVLVI